MKDKLEKIVLEFSQEIGQRSFDSDMEMTQKAYELGKQESQWICVDERLPEDKVATRYLVIRIDGSINMDIWTPFHGRRFDFMYRVTHWMQLPKQP